MVALCAAVDASERHRQLLRPRAFVTNWLDVYGLLQV